MTTREASKLVPHIIRGTTVVSMARKVNNSRPRLKDSSIFRARVRTQVHPSNISRAYQSATPMSPGMRTETQALKPEASNAKTVISKRIPRLKVWDLELLLSRLSWITLQEIKWIMAELEVPNPMRDLLVHIAKYILIKISSIILIKARGNELPVSVARTNNNSLRLR